ncbi:hypothetical protein [Kocuria sp.]|uniref:hypothetical protein n=1 Tax=Kocuria sp. TaxID=1871328 RepID=UPI0026DF7C3F|nr:hypothetical protein [Kocuria sp.]MDO5619332.1 hypothetical protein [Kocuria sp.]
MTHDDQHLVFECGGIVISLELTSGDQMDSLELGGRRVLLVSRSDESGRKDSFLVSRVEVKSSGYSSFLSYLENVREVLVGSSLLRVEQITDPFSGLCIGVMHVFNGEPCAQYRWLVEVAGHLVEVVGTTQGFDLDGIRGHGQEIIKSLHLDAPSQGSCDHLGWADFAADWMSAGCGAAGGLNELGLAGREPFPDRVMWVESQVRSDWQQLEFTRQEWGLVEEMNSDGLHEFTRHINSKILKRLGERGVLGGDSVHEPVATALEVRTSTPWLVASGVVDGRNVKVQVWQLASQILIESSWDFDEVPADTEGARTLTWVDAALGPVILPEFLRLHAGLRTFVGFQLAKEEFVQVFVDTADLSSVLSQPGAADIGDQRLKLWGGGPVGAWRVAVDGLEGTLDWIQTRRGGAFLLVAEDDARYEFEPVSPDDLLGRLLPSLRRGRPGG